MKNLYFFILGHNPSLSTAEIASQMKGKIINLSDSFLILQSEEKIDANFWQEKLGGTIKIGTIIDGAKNFKSEMAIEILSNFRRPHFGFSSYGDNSEIFVRSACQQSRGKSAVDDRNLRLKIKDWALKIKKELREKGISSRWVESKEKNLSSVIVQKNKLLTEGVEFVFLNNGKKSYWGQTLSCQAFENYSRRDFNRPARNIKEGMLPPKLAKIMINLASVSNEKTILDPFCGSGTILQEAILMDYKNIIGTDLSEVAVENSQKNITWLLDNYQKSSAKYQIFQADVRNLSEKISPNSIDAIVTEPYLGPIKLARPLTRELKNIINSLSELYLKTFSEFKRLLKPNGKIVVIFPAFSTRGGSAFGGKTNYQLNFLPILDELKKMGWQFVQILPKELSHLSTERGSIIYSRPNQTVLREIFILKHS